MYSFMVTAVSHYLIYERKWAERSMNSTECQLNCLLKIFEKSTYPSMMGVYDVNCDMCIPALNMSFMEHAPWLISYIFCEPEESDEASEQHSFSIEVLARQDVNKRSKLHVT